MRWPGAKSGRRRGPARGTLILIAGMLISSAILRLGDGAGTALALVSNDGPVTRASRQGATTPDCAPPPDLAQVLNALSAREARIEESETALRNRMQALQRADHEISRKLVELTEAEESLRQTIAIADDAAETDLDRLTKVYETMKPKQAAALFEQMDPNFAAGFLGRMRPESAAGIMASLSPGAAHGFSVVLAGRNANAPSE